MVVHPGGIESVAQRGQRVEQSGDRVHHRFVVVLPARLVLFGTVVMVDRVDDPAGLLRRRAEHHRRLAAVRTDLDADAVIEVADGGVVQRAALVGRHETDHVVGKCEQAGGGLGEGCVGALGEGSVGSAHGGQPTVAGQWQL